MDSAHDIEVVPLLVTGVQLGKSRFSQSRVHEEGRPAVAYGRCNLVSQELM